jgi:excisionase family DNA binding protein
MSERLAPLVEPLLTTSEVAGWLGCDEKTLRQIVTDGKLPRVLIGKRRVMFDPADVRAYIEGAKECQSTAKADSGTTTSNIKAVASTARPDRKQSGRLKPWSANGDMKPRPALTQTQAK